MDAVDEKINRLAREATNSRAGESRAAGKAETVVLKLPPHPPGCLLCPPAGRGDAQRPADGRPEALGVFLRPLVRCCGCAAREAAPPAALDELGAGVGTHPAAAVAALANLLKGSPITAHAGA